MRMRRDHINPEYMLNINCSVHSEISKFWISLQIMDFQNCYFLGILLLAIIEFTISKVTKKDIEKQLGINLSQAPRKK